MAYTLTKADMDAIDNQSNNASSSGGYVPTKADLDEWDAKLNNQSLVPSAPNFPLTTGQKIANTVENIGSKAVNFLMPGLTNIGKTVASIPDKASAAMQAVKDLAGGATKGLIASGVNPNLTALFNNNNPVSNFGNPQSLAYGAGKLAGVTAPAILAGEGGMAALPEDAGRLLQGSVAGAAAGAATPSFNPQNELAGRIQNAAMGGIGGAVLGGVASIPKAISSLKNIFNNTADNAMQGVASNYLASSLRPSSLITKDAANNNLNDALIGNFNNKVSQGSQNYQNLFKEAASKNYVVNNDVPKSAMVINKEYSGNIQEPYPGAFSKQLPQTTQKNIILSQNTNDSFYKLLTDENTPNNVRNSLLKYKNNINLQNLHSLQSDLYKYANKLNPASSSLNMNTVDYLNEARSNILNDISNSFQKNNDFDLLSKFNDAQNFWKNEVVPYQNNQLISKILNNQKVPNLVNDLGTYEPPSKKTPGTYSVLRNDISQNPNQLNTLIGAVLSKGTTINGRNVVAPAKSVLKAYTNSPDTILKMIEPVVGDKIDQVDALHQVANNFLPRTLAQIKAKPLSTLMKAGLTVGGLGAGTAGIGYGVHKIIEQ